MVPVSAAVRPNGFRVNSSGNELTISWGIQGHRKALAVVLAILCLLLLLVFRSNSSTLLLCGLLLLGSIYWLIAMFSNRTILRVTEVEWVIWQGPVPLPTRDYSSHKKRIDPSRFIGVVALEDPEKHSWGRVSDWADLLFELVRWLVHKATRASRVTYTLFGQTADGERAKLLGGLTKGQASALKQRLEDLLPSDVLHLEELGEDVDGDERQRVLPTSEGTIQGQDADAPNVKASASPGPGNVEDPLPRPVCPECGGTNPSGSAFCGECGMTLIPAAA